MRYKIYRLITRILPTSLASKAVRLFGLKIPITPAALAGSLMMVAGIITKDAEAKVVEIRQEGKGIDGTDSELDAELVAVEVLCALYCLAIAALQN